MRDKQVYNLAIKLLKKHGFISKPEYAYISNNKLHGRLKTGGHFVISEGIPRDILAKYKGH